MSVEDFSFCSSRFEPRELELLRIESWPLSSHESSLQLSKLKTKDSSLQPRYLDILDTGRYNEHGGTTKLDRHRVNLCRKEIESILQRIKINGELPSDRYTRIAMAHAYQYLKRMKKLREDVS